VESIEACHRLIDLGAYQVVDAEILSLLGRAVDDAVSEKGMALEKGVASEKGVFSGTGSCWMEYGISSLCVLVVGGALHGSVGKLLSRVVCQKSVPPDVWEVCAQFHLKSTNPIDNIKVHRFVY